MSLTREDVIKIARLARLALTDEELSHYQGQLSAVLDYAARLNELDLSGVDAIAGPTRQNITRDDVVAASLPRDDALYNAAQTADGHFLIQSVLEE